MQDPFADVRRASPTAAGMNPPSHRSHRRIVGWAAPQSYQASGSYGNLPSSQIAPVRLNSTYPPRQSGPQPRQQVQLAGQAPPRRVGTGMSRANSFGGPVNPPSPKSLDAQWMKGLALKVANAGGVPPSSRTQPRILRTADATRGNTARGIGSRGGPISEGDKVVFLDVDGVLHPYHARPNQQFRPACMKRLKAIIDTTGAKIVLSTSWRRTARATAAVNLQLKRHDIPTAVDKTRIRNNEYLRNEEVLHWIAQHPYVTHWVAIDDLPMPQLGEHYIQTSPDTGITESDMNKAIRVLTDPRYTKL